MTLEHLGIAIDDGRAVDLFRALLGAEPYKVETVEREGVRTVFLGDGGEAGRAPKLELLEALSPESPVATYLEKRGPGLHHVAFEVDDLPAVLARARAAGFTPLSDEPKRGADGKRIAFLHPKTTGGVLVELCEAAPEWERLDVPFDGGHLAVFVAGPPEAPPLVVLHGALGSTAVETVCVARRWASDFRVYALDFLGHGASGAFPDTPLTADGFAANVVALMDAVGVGQAHVFGFSLGAAVALHTAARHPGRVGRLALLGTNVQWSPDEARAMTAAMAAALDDPEGRWGRRLADAHGEGRWRGLAERMIRFTRDLPAHRVSDATLAGVRTPALVVHGDRDRYFDVRHAVHLRRVLPNARLWVIPGLDHPIQRADDRALAAEVAAFLRG